MNHVNETGENLEAVIRRSQENDLEAQELLVTQYQNRIAGFVYSMLGHEDCIEDLTQTIFLKALKKLPSLKKIEKFQSWLFSIARNTCLDHLRTRRWKQLFTHFTQDHEQIPSSPTNQQFAEKHEWLLNELKSLPENQREVIILLQDDSLSYQQMADILGCSLESVKIRIFRARNTLNERRIKYEKSK